MVAKQRSVAIAELQWSLFDLTGRVPELREISLRWLISTKGFHDHSIFAPFRVILRRLTSRHSLPIVEPEPHGTYFSFGGTMKKPKDISDVPSGTVRAFIICGGAGTRLRPVLADRPKSMALIGGKPFLQLLLERLTSQGVNDVILGTGYMAEKIEGYFDCGSKLAMRIHYSREYEPLGTGGSLKLAEPLISDPVLVLNGDSYVEWSLVPMLELFRAKDADMVIVLHAVSDVARYGSVALDNDGRITQFLEKGLQTGHGLINAGVYLLRKQIVHEFPAGTAISLERDVFPRLLNRGVYGLVCPGLFIDIGVPDDFKRAQALLASRVSAASHDSSA
jgi:D-glycero-alpha-D-manno-heptose 1-phosphate guanylyltransferase